MVGVCAGEMIQWIVTRDGHSDFFGTGIYALEFEVIPNIRIFAPIWHRIFVFQLEKHPPKFMATRSYKYSRECYRLIALMIIAGRVGLVGSGIVTQCLSLARSVSLVFSVSRWGILWLILKSCRYLYQVLKLDISLMEMSVMVRISNV